jgi:hypothetical protein
MARIKKELTAAPLEIPARVVSKPIEPETIRLPKNGERDPHFGLSRSALNSLVLPTPGNKHCPPVKSFVLRQRGSRTGIRLVSFSSLRNWIYQHAEVGTDTEGAVQS